MSKRKTGIEINLEPLGLVDSLMTIINDINTKSMVDNMKLARLLFAINPPVVSYWY